MRHRQLTLGVTLALGILVTTAVAALVGNREIAAARLRYQQRTSNLTAVLQRNLTRHVDILHALGDYYQAIDLDVDPEQFRRFVARSLAENPGIQALEWAPYILVGQRQAFEALMQAKGVTDFQITERDASGNLVAAAWRRTYVPVAYVEPFAGNEVAVGFDLASNPVRRQALEQARITGQVVASGRITLVQETADQYGFLVFLPLFNQRRFEGYLLGVFRVADVIAEAIATLQTDLSFHLYDDSALPAEAYLGTYDAGSVNTIETNRYPRFWNRLYLGDYSQHFEFGGRQWRLDFVPPAYPLQMPIATIATVVVGGLITAILLVVQQRSRLALAQAQELSELKQQLFGMASHELRTPLSTILLSAQSLEADPQLSPERARRIYQRIRSAAKHMTQLLNDLLTLNRAEAGKLDYEPEAMCLNDFCHTCVAMVEADQAPRICFRYRGSPEPVWLDPKLVHAIVTNLLANALKYSDASVSFDVEHYAHQASFTVRDHGAGIPTNEQTRVFETFYRGSNAACLPGTGLGLAIVQSCVKLHRGTIHLSKNHPQGSVFTVQLPTHPPSDSPHHKPTQ